MTLRSAFLLQMIEKIGAPIMASIVAVNSRSPGQGEDAQKNPAQDVERLAALLGKSVQLGIALSEAMEVRDKSGQDDSIRLALTAVSAELVAGHYGHLGKIPEDADIRRMAAALQAALTFADHFTASPEAVGRMQNIDFMDQNQNEIAYIYCFVPAAASVSTFSFGRQDKVLLQDIAARLVEKCALLKADIEKSRIDAGSKTPDLALLRAAVRIYTQCHEEEKQKLLSLPQHERDTASAASMDTIWKAVDSRLALLGHLSKHAVPSDIRETGNSGGQIPVSDAVARAAVAPPASASPPQAEKPTNPMGFFKPGAKKAVQQEESGNG